MDTFSAALLSVNTGRIPEGYDWFAPLIGDWDCDYYDEWEGKPRHVKGEWLFRRVLDGTGVQDVFIFPSRATRELFPQPDAEYGSSLRLFDPARGCYDVTYACAGTMKQLCFRMDGGRLSGKVLDEEATYWEFSDMTGESFHWEFLKFAPDGSRTLVCEIFGKRAG